MKIDIKLTALIIGAVLTVVLGIVVYFAYVKNIAIALDEAVVNAKSDVTLEEKRRADLIPNLVECVKAYDKYEYETLLALVNARNSNDDANVEEIKTKIAAVAEAYPQLQSQTNYNNLMNELSITENKIIDVRKAYNNRVNDYNVYCKQFPNKQILSINGYIYQEYQRIEFNISPDAPAVNFN